MNTTAVFFCSCFCRFCSLCHFFAIVNVAVIIIVAGFVFNLFNMQMCGAFSFSTCVRVCVCVFDSHCCNYLSRKFTENVYLLNFFSINGLNNLHFVVFLMHFECHIVYRSVVRWGLLFGYWCSKRDASEFLFYTVGDQCLNGGWPICCLFNTLTFWLLFLFFRSFVLQCNDTFFTFDCIRRCDYCNHECISVHRIAKQANGGNTKCARHTARIAHAMSVCEENVDFSFRFIYFYRHCMTCNVQLNPTQLNEKRMAATKMFTTPNVDLKTWHSTKNPQILEIRMFFFSAIATFSSFKQQFDLSALQSCKSIENLYNVNGIPLDSRIHWVRAYISQK